MERSEVAERYKWRVQDIFASDEAWEQEYAAAEKCIDFSAFAGKLADPAQLAALFARQEEAGKRIERLYLYAHMRHIRPCSPAPCRCMCAILPNRRS